jgi:quinoprotein glucose dehydrogenase
MDVFGAERDGSDRYGSSVVALNVKTGEMVWNFQVVHHDRWDYDVASQPVLYTQRIGGEEIPAVAVATKMGHIFLLDRRNGEPLFPVVERPVPATDVPEEKGKLSPTQPFPTHPEPLYNHSGVDFLRHSTCVRDFLAEKLGLSKMRNDGIFTPPSTEGSMVYPGPAGGINWGSLSISPDGLAIAELTHLPFVFQLVKKPEPFKPFVDGNGDQSDLTANLEGSPYYYKRWVPRTLHIPCFGLPAGELVAIDLETGEIRWRETWGGGPTGTPLNASGAVLQTASGVGFSSYGYLKKFMAIDLKSGKKIWDAKLNAAAGATPMTYLYKGEQYVVVTVGGAGGFKPDDSVVAYKLKR